MVYTHFFELYTVVLALIDNGKAIIIQLFKVEYKQEFAILGVTNTYNYIKKCIPHIYLAAKDCR